MKIADSKTIVTALLTLLILTGIFLINNKSYALAENVPSIVSFNKSTAEDNALKIEIQSNNTGSDFSLEVLDVTAAPQVTRVNLAGSVTSYTFQNLEANKEYEIMVRACSIGDNKYTCTDYSPSVKAVAGKKDGSDANPNKLGVGQVIISPESYIYDGQVKTPEVTVTDSEGTYITKDQDYTVTYQEGRINVGTYTVTVKGIGNYEFEVTKQFTISKAGIKSAKLSTTSYTYNGKVKTPAVTVINKQNKKLTKNTHYTVKYPSGRKKVGTYTVVVKGKGNYSFTKNLKFTINKKSSGSGSSSEGEKTQSSPTCEAGYKELNGNCVSIAEYECRQKRGKKWINGKCRSVDSTGNCGWCQTYDKKKDKCVNKSGYSYRHGNCVKVPVKKKDKKKSKNVIKVYKNEKCISDNLPTSNVKVGSSCTSNGKKYYTNKKYNKKKKKYCYRVLQCSKA